MLHGKCGGTTFPHAVWRTTWTLHPSVQQHTLRHRHWSRHRDRRNWNILDGRRRMPNGGWGIRWTTLIGSWMQQCTTQFHLWQQRNGWRGKRRSFHALSQERLLSSFYDKRSRIKSISHWNVRQINGTSVWRRLWWPIRPQTPVKNTQKTKSL